MGVHHMLAAVQVVPGWLMGIHYMWAVVQVVLGVG
jgi:hypothetical protein